MYIKSPPVDNDSGDTGWFERNLYDLMINELERDEVGARLRSHGVTVVTEEGNDDRGF